LRKSNEIKRKSHEQEELETIIMKKNLKVKKKIFKDVNQINDRMVKLPQLSQIPNAQSERISPFKLSENTAINGKQTKMQLPSPLKLNIKTLDSR